MNNLSKLFSVLALIAITGCNQANLQVAQEGPTAPSSSQKTPSGSATPISQKPTTITGGNSKVFFERVLTQGSELDQLIAVSFSSRDSTTTTPMGVALKSPVDFSPVPIVVSAGKQLIYLQSNGLMSSSLVSTNLGTLSSQSVYEFPSQVVAVSANAAAQTVAVIDAQGNVSVTNIATQATQPVLSSSSDRAARVQLNAAGDRLLVRTAGNTLFTYVFDPSASTWRQVLNVPAVTAATLNKDGSRLAYVTADAKLFLADPANAQSQPTQLSVLESSAVFDLSWKLIADDLSSRLSYWTRLPSGADEIRTLNTDGTPQEQTVIRVSVPASVADGVVCPTWAGDSLYFSQFTQGEYQIEKAQVKSGGPAQAVPFAIPPANDEGFVCPAAAQGDAS